MSPLVCLFHVSYNECVKESGNFYSILFCFFSFFFFLRWENVILSIKVQY